MASRMKGIFTKERGERNKTCFIIWTSSCRKNDGWTGIRKINRAEAFSQSYDH
ncbi:hypothetical protein HFA01_10150 [Halobacillus faecis]|uniref:Uncharacterized protein n=1 Tax=Halobacillus faecis TaxID=360184 RepID=A0A511WR93_9BACI|nr:hypothetical protein HFA01_10150 [Halobacillus faecis]